MGWSWSGYIPAETMKKNPFRMIFNHWSDAFALPLEQDMAKGMMQIVMGVILSPQSCTAKVWCPPA